jgi:hypothetical protein
LSCPGLNGRLCALAHHVKNEFEVEGVPRTRSSAAEKYIQVQHSMWLTNARMAALSIITGGGKWVEISIAAGGWMDLPLCAPIQRP